MFDSDSRGDPWCEMEKCILNAQTLSSKCILAMSLTYI